MTDTPNDYDAEWDELDEKVVLVQILAELQQIRRAVTDAEAEDTDDDTMYRCTRCPDGTTVAEADRARHAQKQHRAPPGGEMAMFEKVDQ